MTLTDPAPAPQVSAIVGRGSIAVLAGAAATLAVISGVLVGSLLLVGLGVIGLGAVGMGVFVKDPTALVLAFVAGRGLLDVSSTYDIGVSLNAPAAALVLIVIGRWFWMARGHLVTPSPSVWAALLLAAAALASVPGSMSPTYSMSMALRVVVIVALFAFAEQRAREDPRFVTHLCGAILVSAVAVSMVAVAQIFDLIPLPGEDASTLDPQLTRPPGPYPAATVFSTHLFLAVPVVLLLMSRIFEDRRLRFLTPHLVALGVFILWLMLENKSRSPLIGLAIAIAIMVGIGRRWLAGLVGLCLVLAGIALIPAGALRVDELGSGSDPGASADTFAWRVDYWERNLGRIGENPITGIGLGRVEQVNLDGHPPHNTLVQAVVEMGAFGLVAYMSLIAVLAADLSRVVRGSRGTSQQAAALMALGVAVGYFFIGLFENLLTQLATSGIAAALIGSVIGSSRAGRSP